MQIQELGRSHAIFELVFNPAPPIQIRERYVWKGVPGIWWLFVGKNKISEMHVKVGTYFDVGRVTMLV